VRQQLDKEPLLPEWVTKWIKILLPIGGFIGIWLLNDRYFHLQAIYWIPTLFVLVLGVLIFLLGRLYKPYFVNKEGRCIASGRINRVKCRHYVLGARLGMGCGRQREDGYCIRKVGMGRVKPTPQKSKSDKTTQERKRKSEPKRR